ncbi:AAA family ATPase [Nitrososphaera sp.]|uniref:tyrosine-protein kinase family protein n=1 Tax=Nitrososphaera sp. TaxID=1971748 RepID=UPI00307D4D07
MAKCIAFHSYKGGTGKTTIASNCAAVLTKRGYKVALLDLDVYAPSLYAYFGKEPRKWLNDYLQGDADVEDVMVDATDTVREYAKGDMAGGDGRLWIGMCSMKKEEVYKMESNSLEGSRSQLRRFILLREQLISNYSPDYIMIDTSPGIRYWSINALAVADALLLTLKVGEIDIDGTNRLASEIYSSLTKYGAKSFLLLNRVAGYCVPDAAFAGGKQQQHDSNDNAHHHHHQHHNDDAAGRGGAGYDPAGLISGKTGMQVITSIPCYCDIQFSSKEFLTALVQPGHPFARQIENLIEAMRLKV